MANRTSPTVPETCGLNCERSIASDFEGSSFTLTSTLGSLVLPVAYTYTVSPEETDSGRVALEGAMPPPRPLDSSVSVVSAGISGPPVWDSSSTVPSPESDPSSFGASSIQSGSSAVVLPKPVSVNVILRVSPESNVCSRVISCTSPSERTRTSPERPVMVPSAEENWLRSAAVSLMPVADSRVSSSPSRVTVPSASKVPMLSWFEGYTSERIA